MKAAMLDAPYSFRIADQPLPTLKPGWALMKVKAAGICGSDMHFYRGDLPFDPGSVRGHEAAGVVADPGGSNLTVGQPIILDPLVGCGHCGNCRRGHYHICENIEMIGRDYAGGFAEYVAAPAEKFYPFNVDVLPFAQAALADCVAVGVHAVNSTEIAPGQSIVVIGDGTIGLLLLQAAVARGANPAIVIGKHERNLELARRMGATHTLDVRQADLVSAVRNLADEIDVVFEAAGGPAPMFEPALRMIRKGGRVALLGLTASTTLPVPWIDVVVDEHSLIGLQGYSNHRGQDEMRQTIDLMESGRVRLPDDAVTTMPLTDIDRGFRMMLDRAKTGTVKVVLLSEAE